MMAIEIIEEKEIDSIIDKAKASGLYSLESINIKDIDNCQHIDDFFSEYNSTDSFFDNIPESNLNIKEIVQNEQKYDINERSDSEVTVIRVRKERLQLNKLTCYNNWAEIHDEAVPGDGTHLGQSPSLVNLVTFITNTSNIQKEAGEYMIPLSTWNPTSQNDTLTTKSESIQIKELHRSLNISRISNSNLHIPYMLKRKLSPRPGALFSHNVKLSKNMEIENCNVVSLCDNEDGDKNEFDIIKPPPPSLHNNPRTLMERLRCLVKVTFCACCRLSKSKNTTNNKNTNVHDKGVQTILSIDLENNI